MNKKALIAAALGVGIGWLLSRAVPVLLPIPTMIVLTMVFLLILPKLPE